MELIPTPIEGVAILEPKVFGDERGFFLESWNAETFAAIGIDQTFVQDNHSRSSRGVLRGMHYQLPGAQGKLIRVVAGAVYDAVVDMRRSSPSFGQSYGLEISAANKRMLWIPPGIAHGFLTLEDGTDFLYKCTAPYRPEYEQTLRWDDPTVAIAWPLEGIEPLLSAKDQAGRAFAEAVTFP